MEVQEAEGHPGEAAGEEAEGDQPGEAEAAGEVHHSREAQSLRVRGWNTGGKPLPIRPTDDSLSQKY